MGVAPLGEIGCHRVAQRVEGQHAVGVIAPGVECPLRVGHRIFPGERKGGLLPGNGLGKVLFLIRFEGGREKGVVKEFPVDEGIAADQISGRVFLRKPGPDRFIAGKVGDKERFFVFEPLHDIQSAEIRLHPLLRLEIGYLLPEVGWEAHGTAPEGDFLVGLLNPDDVSGIVKGNPVGIIET